MKKFYLLFFIAVVNTVLFAQAPQKFSYQAVVRDLNSVLITNQKIGVKISVLQNSAQGTSVYEETHNVLSNENGLISLEIGTGKSLVGTFSAINWSTGSYFVKNDIDPKGGENYTIVSTSQLMSVPYALFAANSQPGPKGDKGDTGATGKDGAVGPQGLQGPIGLTGPAGKDGTGSTPGKIPTVSTDKVEEIIKDAPSLKRYLKVTHTVTDDGGETVLKRGFCFSENPNPTTAGKSFSNNYSSSIGVATDSIFEIKSNQKYYIRAYAVNTKGTAYGNEMVISTMDIKLPTVTTVAVNDIGYREATVVGSVNNTGNQKPKIGFCLGSHANLNVDNTDFFFYCDSLTNFSKKIPYLNHSSSYYVRAFAENSMGIAYGNELNFVTLKILKPNVQTIGVDSVGYDYASISGKIISNGGDSITMSGICIGTTNMPTVKDTFVYNNSYYSSSIIAMTNNLAPNTTYYARAYAKNNAGESYGNAIKFNTLNLIVTTNTVKDINLFDASFSGDVTNDNGISNYEKGFCYSVHTNPTSQDGIVTNWNNGNSFVSSTNNLIANTTYYVKAFVKVNNNYVYGNEVSFKTLNINLTTNPVINNKGIKANLTGAVSDTILAKNYNLGFCLSTSINPTTNDQVATNFWYAGTTNFQSEVTGLKTNTSYYVRSFLKDYNNNIVYGNQVTFKTGAIKLPTISTDSINNINLHTANAYSTIVDDGGDEITEKGFCIATHTTPTINDIAIQDNYMNSFSNLISNTKYYVRAYAKNSMGIAYGNEINFTTSQLKVETVSITKTTFASAEFKAKIIAKPKNSNNNYYQIIYLLISKKSNPTFQQQDVILSNNWSYSTGDSLIVSYNHFDPSTTYYVKAAYIYNYNTSDTVYGSQLTFTTSAAPTLQTFTPSKIASNSVYLSGSNANTNGYLFTERGFALSTLPTISYTNMGNMINAYGNGIGEFNTTATLEPNITYYVKAYAKTSDGLTVFGNEFSFKTLSIGQKGQGGGIVFYDKGEVTDGWRYLEIASNDQSTGAIWGCENVSPAAYNSSLGGGLDNTNAIATSCSDQNSAAKICYNLVLNNKSDWYLPSSEELMMAYQNIHLKNNGNFNLVYYWTSNFGGSNNAMLIGFSNGDTQYYDAKFTGSVRAMRKY